jgi:hypothetical protein
MQILFEDLTLQEVKVVVDALDNHRKLIANTEQEAEQAMINQRAELDDWKESCKPAVSDTYTKAAFCKCHHSCFLLKDLPTHVYNQVHGNTWDCDELGHDTTVEKIKEWYANQAYHVEPRLFANTNPDNGLEGHWITKTYPAVQAKETSIEYIRNAYTSAVLAQHLSNPEVQGDLEACGQQGNRLGKLIAGEFKAAYEAHQREVERTGDLSTPLRLTANTLIDRSVQEAADLAYARSLTGSSMDDPNFTWPTVDVLYNVFGGNYRDDTD